MTAFKKNDILRCIDDESFGFTLGNLYRVGVGRNTCVNVYDDDGDYRTRALSEFVLAEPTVGDFVRIVKGGREYATEIGTRSHYFLNGSVVKLTSTERDGYTNYVATGVTYTPAHAGATTQYLSRDEFELITSAEAAAPVAVPDQLDFTKPLETTSGAAFTLVTTEGEGAYPVLGYISGFIREYNVEGKDRQDNIAFRLRNAVPKPATSEVYMNVYKKSDGTLWTAGTVETKEKAIAARLRSHVGMVKVMLVEGEYCD